MDSSLVRIGVNVTEREVENLSVNWRQTSEPTPQALCSQKRRKLQLKRLARFSGSARTSRTWSSSMASRPPRSSTPRRARIACQLSSLFKLQASLENGKEFCVESNNYPAEVGTGTGGKVSVITSPARTACWGRCRVLSKREPGCPELLQLTATPTAASSRSCRSRRSASTSSAARSAHGAEETRLPLRQLRGLPPRRRRQLRRSRASAAAWSRAVPAIAPLRPGSTSPDAELLPDASASPDFDIKELQSLENVEENSVSARFDFRINEQWSSYVRVFQTAARRSSGRRQRARRAGHERTDQRHLQVQGTLDSGLLTESRSATTHRRPTSTASLRSSTASTSASRRSN